MERRLLTALTATHPSEVAVDTLLGRPVGCGPTTTARKTLQTNVLRLRQVLGIDAIVTTPDGYRLGRSMVVKQSGSSGPATWRGGAASPSSSSPTGR